ncbi:MAG: phage baseplate assembly protein [Chelatococcus sp.]|nr:MAG: phage baseplate assembly protein [Chelatococcus sp.]
MARTDADGPYSLQSLAAMSVPALFERDPEVLKAKYVAWFEGATNRTLYPMQVEMLLIELLAYVVSLLGEEGQIAAEEHLVAKASRTGLIAMGANRSTLPLDASTATTTIRFTLSAARAINVLISEGARISAGSGGLIFTTTAPAIIPAGSLTADAPAMANAAGGAGNGFLPGQIATMLDPVPGVSAVNIVASEGGSDAEETEAYRLRVANAFDRVSPGGGLGWYTETAIAVSPVIIDVAIVRPLPCYVDIYPLTAAGAAGSALRDQVKAAFNTREALEIRFGDEVTVKAAVAVPIAPALAVYLTGATEGANELAASVANLVLAGWRQRLAPVLSPGLIEETVKARLKDAGFTVDDVQVTDMAFERLAAEEYAVPVLIQPEDVVLEAADG